MKIRVGQGFDVHRFSEERFSKTNRELKLGGVAIPYERTLLAHSDGDVVIHALCDAILGAIGAGDIGRHFPDTDAQFKNADSAGLLSHVIKLAGSDGWRLINADLTVVAEAPKLAPYINEMRDRLSSLMLANSDVVNIKATTSEGLGFTGRKEGIASFAVVLLEQSSA